MAVAMETAVQRAQKVFCTGPLLDAVQRSGLFVDSKTFVDMPLMRDPEEVLEAFAALPSEKPVELLRSFVAEHFEHEGQELEEWTPPDWTEAPTRLQGIKGRGTEYREFALQLNKLWKVLGRIQKPSVAAAPQRHSALVRERGMMLPGGRFRETYYWDTYWIVRGLLICGMHATARGMVNTLLDDVRRYGFVPNGGRVYYLDRSQPPLLAQMVSAVHEAAPDVQWLGEALPALETEYHFWMDPAKGHRKQVALPGSRAEEFVELNVYKSAGSTPRPESYIEDVRTSDQALEALGRDAAEVWRNLRSGAESGWDYSSRWLAEETGPSSLSAADLATINMNVVPVDLNAWLYGMEKAMARMVLQLGSEGSEARAAEYEAAAAKRSEDIEHLLWAEEVGSFKDFRIDEKRHSRIAALSDFAVPLWVGLYGRRGPAGASEALARSGLLQKGGALTTTAATGQQWDKPNGWPPLQLMLVEGLDAMRGSSKEAGRQADELAAAWLQNCFTAWQASGVMHEKYDAEQPGCGGGGGEYEPQTGFGWSNGVALALILRAEDQWGAPA